MHFYEKGLCVYIERERASFTGPYFHKTDFSYFSLQIIDEILKINEDSRVHGLALQISESSFSNKVLNALKPEKDVDG